MSDNPTSDRLAVALAYEEGSAPRVTAAGSGEIAKGADKFGAFTKSKSDKSMRGYEQSDGRPDGTLSVKEPFHFTVTEAEESDGDDTKVDFAAASERTLERLFHAEVGLSLGRWQQQVRLLHALQLLAGERSVTEVALRVGFESPSAFIAMFRRAMGTTPSRYFHERGS